MISTMVVITAAAQISRLNLKNDVMEMDKVRCKAKFFYVLCFILLVSTVAIEVLGICQVGFTPEEYLIYYIALAVTLISIYIYKLCSLIRHFGKDPMLRPELTKTKQHSSCFIISLIIFLMLRIMILAEILSDYYMVTVVYLGVLFFTDIVPTSYVVHCHFKTFTKMSEQQYMSRADSDSVE